jgi:hypothetical protein
MKYRTGEERRQRKELKALGQWPVKQKPEPPFACERVLAEAPLAVQDLLIKAMSRKKSYNQIRNEARVRQPYTKISDPKKKTKTKLMHRPVEK